MILVIRYRTNKEGRGMVTAPKKKTSQMLLIERLYDLPIERAVEKVCGETTRLESAAGELCISTNTLRVWCEEMGVPLPGKSAPEAAGVAA